MKKLPGVDSVLILGAGPIVIGQACEFDYSGSQACKVFREEGARIILVNSNPATIMTDTSMADATYIEPINIESITEIIAKERPDAIVAGFGGQTALNCAMILYQKGILEEYGIQLLGSDEKAISTAEDRKLFSAAVEKIGFKCPESMIAENFSEAEAAIRIIGLPAIIRPSYTLGGEGGGIAYNPEEFASLAISALRSSLNGSIQIDKSLIGWKEYEMEILRDSSGNSMLICSIENIDPMGVHTGDSITVAPSITLSDKEYQKMRHMSFAVAEAVGMKAGGANVQFAVNPKDGNILVIEMNPRVSRSSALASKATGFPIAKMAARLCSGYSLKDLQNDYTGKSGSAEPAIDYVAIKVPKFTFDKFPGVDRNLTTSMRSVGEVMAIGGNFKSALQKGFESLEESLDGLQETCFSKNGDKETIVKNCLSELKGSLPEKFRIAADALRFGASVKEVCNASNYDLWFVNELKDIIEDERFIKEFGVPNDFESMLHLKRNGFSDARIAFLASRNGKNILPEDVKIIREKLDIHPCYRNVDTCAAEFESKTAFMYSCFEMEPENAKNFPIESPKASNKKKIIILGSGPNRIGQGIEFDYICVKACMAVRKAGFEAIMINCNPETVSTDSDISDKLYFEPLTEERVLAVLAEERKNGEIRGVIVQLGGQTPLKLEQAIRKAGFAVLGSKGRGGIENVIATCEDRGAFNRFINYLGLQQPESVVCSNYNEAIDGAKKLGYPLLVRPSYVLGGRAMVVINDEKYLKTYLSDNAWLFEQGELLLDCFINDAVELDVDALCDGEQAVIGCISEHIEEAGVHSGDSCCLLSPRSLSKEMIAEVERQTILIGTSIGINGLYNVQFAVKERKVYVIEVNPRASRTVPLIVKAFGSPMIEEALNAMLFGKISSNLPRPKNIFAIKKPVFPFTRFPGANAVLGVEMRSTGEVMGIATDFETAFSKACEAVGEKIPVSGNVFISVRNTDKLKIVSMSRDLERLGFKIFATSGTAAVLKENGVTVCHVNKISEGRPHIVDMLLNGEIDYVVNTTDNNKAIVDSLSIRRIVFARKILYSPTINNVTAVLSAIRRKIEEQGKTRTVISLQELRTDY